MNLSKLRRLADRWEEQIENLRTYGAGRQAKVLEAATQEFRDTVQEWLDEPLTSEQAASESGYTAESLRRMVRDGDLPNAGQSGQPRILRRHLPRKPGHQLSQSEESPANEDQRAVRSRTQMARSVVESKQGDDDGER